MTESVVKVRDLDLVYQSGNEAFPALSDIELEVGAGEVLGIVGESGCGKSSLSSALLRLLPPNGRITRGHVFYKDLDLLEIPETRMRQFRGAELAMIFQDPLTSLNPTFTIGTQMRDVQRAHGGGSLSRAQIYRRSVEMLEQVGMPDPEDRLRSYPHEFSGGMRQRIMIAVALMLKPGVLIADEPTTALDVTLQAQILSLLRGLCKEEGTATIFISHDLGVVAQICDRVMVMYAGRVVESADLFSLFDEPLHPYTRALLRSIPSRNRRGSRLVSIPGRVPSLSALPSGCKFVNRCPHAQDVCRATEPRFLDIQGHRVRCHAYDSSSGFRDAGVVTADRFGD